MIFFGDESNASLSSGLSAVLKTPLFYPEITVFPDGERRVRLNENVVDKDVIFLKTASVTPNIDSMIVETSFLIDAFKRSGAGFITGIIPYVPYSRADHVFRDGESVPIEVVVALFEKAGLSKIVFVDPHTIKIPEMFTIEVSNLSALSLFAEKIKEIGFDKNSSVIVSPDMGGLRRMEQISELLEKLPFASVQKDRNYEDGSIKDSKINGEIKPTCFIVDDIISTGKTIVRAVEALTKAGAKDIYVFATHAILADDAPKALQDCAVKQVFVTDSMPLAPEKHFPKLEVLSLSKLLVRGLD